MKIVWTLVVLAALGGGGWFYFYHDKDAKAATSPMALDTSEATVVKGDITQSVKSPGTVSSNLDVLIKCQAGGEIISLPYQESDRVKKGDVLIQVDPVPEQRALALAQITMQQDQSRLDQARIAVDEAVLNLKTATEQAAANIIAAALKAKDLRLAADREKQLLDQKLASNQDFETADTAAAQAEMDLATAQIAQEQLKAQAADLDSKKQAVTLAKAQVDSDDVSVKLAEDNLKYCTVSARQDGVVSQVLVQVGGMVSSALNNAGGGTTILTLSDMSHIFIMATVDESDIGDVRVGQKVEIHADAHKRDQFSGIVALIAHEGVNTSNVVTFQVKIEVTSENKDLLKPQMTADVTIIEAQKKGVLLVPLMAVYQKKAKNFVKVIKGDGTNEERPVTLGISDNDNSEITSGLSEGEKVLVVKNDASRWAAQGVPRPPAPRGK